MIKKDVSFPLEDFVFPLCLDTLKVVVIELNEKYDNIRTGSTPVVIVIFIRFHSNYLTSDQIQIEELTTYDIRNL